MMEVEQTKIARMQREKERKEAEEAKKLLARKTIITRDTNPPALLKKSTTMVKSPKKK